MASVPGRGPPRGKLWLFQEHGGGESGTYTKLLTWVWDRISAPMGDGRGEKPEAVLLFSHSLALDSAGWRVDAGPREACTSADPGSLSSVT